MPPPTASLLDVISVWQLKRNDQRVLALVASFLLLAMAGYWVWLGDQVEVDQQPPKTVQFQLDMNQAEWPEWTLMPEIGETLARRIVQYREANGPFRTHEDIQKVRGIGPKTLDKMRPYLKPAPATP